MEFMRFVLSVNRQTAFDIFTTYSQYLQIDVMDKDFTMTNFHTVIKWDHMLKGPLCCNDQDSHMHYVLGRRPLITASVLQRLRLVVSVTATIILRIFTNADLRYAGRFDDKQGGDTIVTMETVRKAIFQCGVGG